MPYFVDVVRWRWRLSGATMWPAFGAAIVVESIMLNELPVWGNGPHHIVPGLLLAMAFNLIVVALLAPMAGMLLRRRRRDLPRVVAADRCGTALIGVLFVALLVGGILNHSDVMRDKRDRIATARAISTFVHNQERDYLPQLERMTVLKLETGFYRGCVPDTDPSEALCIFVNTDQSPAGIKRDPERVPNQLYGR
jgi:hypothetical protein